MTRPRHRARCFRAQPGKVGHRNQCSPDAECVMLIAQDKPFDFAPAKAK
nr:hypothetical protein [Corallococcus coralloides]